MPFKFEKLEIWKLALEYANWIHIVTTKFPKKEMFSLSSQFRRAGNSISLNISEGAIGQSNAEQKKFIGYAIRSLSETVIVFTWQREDHKFQRRSLTLHTKVQNCFLLK